MTFLPIVSRELRVASRRRTTYLSRLIAGVVATVIFGWQMLFTAQLTWNRNQIGPMLFGTLAMFAFVYCLLAGLKATADCISEEKREGTLGLLFLTDLRGYDVVLGKLAATSVNTFYQLLAVMPIMAIPFILGGVSDRTYLRMAALLPNTLLFSLACGMLASAFSRSDRKAAGLAVLLIGLITGGLPLLGVWYAAEFLPAPHTPPMGFLIASPGFSYSALERPGNDFWTSLGTTHLLSWVMLGIASWWLPRAWQDRSASGRRLRIERDLFQKFFGDAEAQAAFRRRLLDRNPVLWLAARNRLDPVLLWGALITGAIVWLGCALRWPKDWFEVPVYLLTGLAMHLVIKAWLAGQACRQFSEDRRSGALELLLATPLGVKEIIAGQLAALRRLFAGPILAVLIADTLMIMGALNTTTFKASSPDKEWVLFLLFAVGTMGMLVIDAWAIAWLGMWFGLTARQANRASSAVISRILLIPGAVMWAGSTLIVLPMAFGRTRIEPEVFLIFWFVIGTVNAGFWLNFARKRLHERMREVATQRYDAPKPGLLSRIFNRTTPNVPPVISRT